MGAVFSHFQLCTSPRPFMAFIVWPTRPPHPLGAAQGISNSAVNIQRQEHLRPRRALTKDSDTGRLVVVNYSTEAAEAQARPMCVRFGFWCACPAEICGKSGVRRRRANSRPPTSNETSKQEIPYRTAFCALCISCFEGYLRVCTRVGSFLYMYDKAIKPATHRFS